ncbi:hypothetical protein BRC81_12585 [Halobacteriales archaeon QS_1_68_20]|nr:MAG: hypothetical protein BRC81_12585 [Halobacteriales archaeon QS_1_68_20]
MDRDALRDEVEEWVREGIITEAQADEILARYEAEEPGRSRVVLALSLLGAALVLIGVTWFLGTNWSDLSRPARAVVLVGGPGLAYAGGREAYDRDAARIGHALCVLGAVLVGPSVFLFEELLAVAVSSELLLLAWAAVALPTGHALASRPATGLGLAVLVGLVVDLADPSDPVLAAGPFGVVLFAVGYARSGRVAWTYRVGGAAVTLGALVMLTTIEGRFASFDLELTTTLVAVAVGALAATAWLSTEHERAGSAWAAAALVALGVSATAAVLAPGTVPRLLAFGVTHLSALAGLFATGYLGFRARSRSLVDLAALGGLFQTLSFVGSTVVDALSGSLALVVAGLILLGVGAAVERGRRSLLAHL